MGLRVVFSALFAGFACLSFSLAANAAYTIDRPPEAPALIRLAEKEIARYVYLRTGLLPTPKGDLHVRLALSDEDALPDDVAEAATTLEGDAYLLRTASNTHYIVGATPQAVLYGAYAFAHALGVRSYLHGDTIPDERDPALLGTSQLDKTAAPLFALRGIQPFHDFPEGPDWWQRDDYKAILAQLPKMGMNFFGLHTYPEDRPAAEPTTWIGRKEDVQDDGTVTFAYPALWYTTTLTSGWGFKGMPTSDYHFGGGLLFDREAYGQDIMRGFAPMPDTPEDCVELFNRAGELFADAFGFAKTLGIKTCLGTETPLVAPRRVAERLVGDAPKEALKPVGGSVAHYTNPIAGTEDDPLYQHVRYGMTAYEAAVTNGRYRVILHLGEPHYSQAGARVFGVRVEDREVIPSIDMFAEVGKDRALVYTFDGIDVEDGHIDITFVPQVEYPCVSAIEVLDENYALRVNCGGPAFGEFAADDSVFRLAPEDVAALYDGIFTRIVRTHPLDYYWLWTPETWTWSDVSEAQVADTLTDIRLAHDALDRMGKPFELATCGWVLGPQFDRALLDKKLPPDITVSCINRAVGHDPVEPGFAEVDGRGQWAIPWLEDDPAMTSLQLWAGRMRRDAKLAREYGCTGLMGIHWRTRILSPNAAALAEAQWDQSGWETPAPDAPGSDKDAPHIPVRDFYGDWARAEFGHEVSDRAADLLADIDGRLPRPSDWIGGPGGYRPDSRPWEEVEKAYAFVDAFAALRGEVRGAGNRDRFDYWLANLEFLRATAKMCCAWHVADVTLARAKKAATPEVQRRRAEEEALPAHIALVAAAEEAYGHLLATVSTSGAMGTIANLEQHTFPGMLDDSAAKLAQLLDSPPPELSRAYTGPPRLVVPSRRGLLEAGEALHLRAIALSQKPPSEMTLHWRRLGEGEFTPVTMENAGRQTYAGAVPGGAIAGQTIEVYVSMKTNDVTVVWPPAAPGLCHTVVVMPE